MNPIRYPLPRHQRSNHDIPFKGIAQWQVPAEWRYWLCDTGSLTQRLVRASLGDFRVLLLRQQHAAACLSEMHRLALPPRSLPLVREVLLLCHEQPWVYARSVIPRATELGAGRHLTRLGTRPLGAALFSDPTVKRGAIWLRHDAMIAPSFDITDISQPLWGRQCLFYLGEAPMLVSEYFLPPCRDYSRSRLALGVAP